MHLDQTAMCPKHGISHGVCVDPAAVETVLVTEKTPKHNHVPAVDCGPGCPFWDEAVGDGGLRATQHIPCSTETVTAAHVPTSCNIADCLLCRDQLPHTLWDDPNRFDPYEALDIIEKEGVSDTILEEVYALRAYITGMER